MTHERMNLNMNQSFTSYIQNSISQITSDDFDSPEALSFLNNPSNFRPFSAGLTELLQKNAYTGALDDNDAKTDYLYKKLKAINSTVSKSTIADWFNGKHRPKLVSNSRTLMYELCFALNIPINEVIWFFHHVYFDRGFNCHTIEEAVYYYCFLHNLSYNDAKSLISEINAAPSKEPDGKDNIYTQYIRNKIDSFSSTNELFQFLANDKSLFNKWNASASACITKLLSEIRGKKEDKKVIEKIRSNKIPSEADIMGCGLVFQECYYYHYDFMTKYVSGKNIASIDFMLESILSTKSGIRKDANIPDVVKNNFPSKKLLSNVLNKLETLTSYDSIRKVLILLNFYKFWCQIMLKITDHSEYNASELYEIFVDETNSLLFTCGYDALYPGNPYDWLFMRASKNETPLDFLRDAIDDILDDEDF